MNFQKNFEKTASFWEKKTLGSKAPDEKTTQSLFFSKSWPKFIQRFFIIRNKNFQQERTKKYIFLFQKIQIKYSI